MKRLVDIGAQIADGLAAAHAGSVVHRDLKPANIMITRIGRVKILDFGLAKQRHPPNDAAQTLPSTESGVVMGTPGYMSPEQVRGEAVDARSDLFSLGAILHEMLAGKPAFAGSSSIEIMNAVLNSEPREIPPAVPMNLTDAIKRCLEKEAALRFQNASDLAFALRHGLPVGPPALQRPLPRLERIAAGLVTLAALIFAVLWFTRPLPAPRVTGVEPVTRDALLPGSSILPLLTDGSRLFYVAQNVVSASGGESVTLNLPLRSDSWVMDIAPDHSEFLACVFGPTGASMEACQLWVVPATGGAPRRLGSLVTDVQDAASWSPDGRYIAYTRNGEVHLATHDGTEIRRLAAFAGLRTYYLRWSRDSSRIRFTVASRPERLWDIDIHGTDLRPFLKDWNPSWSLCCGSWTPDDSYFVFLANGKIWALREKPWLASLSAQPSVLDVGRVVPRKPLPSLDGRRVYFEAFAPRNEFLSYDLNAGAFRLERPGLSATGLTYSRDGKWVAYVSVPEGILFRSAVDGSQRVQLTSPPMLAASPDFSPDGKQIAFRGMLPGGTRIYITAVDGGAPRQVTNGESGDPGEWDASWSPDGRSLAFSGLSLPSRPSEQAIRILDLKSGTISVLPGSQCMMGPAWSPDGHGIAGRCGTNFGPVVLLDVQTRKQTVLLDKVMSGENAPEKRAQTSPHRGLAGGGVYSWSKNGEFLFVSSEDGWWRIRVKDRKVDYIQMPQTIPLADWGWFTTTAGGALVTARNIGTADIYALDWELP